MDTSDVSTGPHQAPLGQPVPSWGIFSRGHREQAPVAPHDVDSSGDEECFAAFEAATWWDCTTAGVTLEPAIEELFRPAIHVLSHHYSTDSGSAVQGTQKVAEGR